MNGRTTKGRWGVAGAMIALGLSLPLTIGCDYSSPGSMGGTSGTLLGVPGSNVKRTKPGPGRKAELDEKRKAILESSITLIQRAALQPGGSHFGQAVQKLNQYFEGTESAKYLLSSAERTYLQSLLPPRVLQGLEQPNWSLHDARHVEDCMMYYRIANRIGGTGEDLDRARRVFDWVVRQVQLVPAGSLNSEQLGQAFARPYDVLLRGMATESEGVWAERAWLFMALCRQLGIDSGLLTYTRGNVLEAAVGTDTEGLGLDPASSGRRPGAKSPIVWLCGVLIGDRVYLFDARLGLEVPGPDGEGVATLEDAFENAAILDRMNLPGEAPYETSRASLLSSPTKIGVLLDSSTGYFTPKMRLLQNELAGKNRSILYRSAHEQQEHFTKALGRHAGVVSLWPLPLQVEVRLFSDPRFVRSIQSSLYLFRPEYPLIYARIKQLRGEFDEAVEEYGKFRLREGLPLVTDKKKTIPKEVQDGLDAYATYYLGLAHLERDNLQLAELMFRRTLETLDGPGPNRPYYNMFHWGANANLGRIYEARGRDREAIAAYAQDDPTTQHIGNLLRARELVWHNPIASEPAPAPSAAPSKPARAASTNTGDADKAPGAR